MPRLLFAVFFLFAPVSGVLAAPALVDGAALEKQLADPKLVLVDMSEDDNQYLRFHLPGAVRLPYDVLVKQRKTDSFAGSKTGQRAKRAGSSASESEPQGRGEHKVPVRLDDAELARVLGRLGIARESRVVIYDDMGGLNAARLFWELERIGHPEVSVLDGGLVRWILDGRKVVNNAPRRAPVAYQLPARGRDSEATLADVRDAGQNRTLLLDVRSDEEYAGEPKKPRTGHVPGARLWPWDLAVDFERGFVQRDEAALKKSLAQAGADPNAPIIAYCRSGHRAARAYLTLRSLGYENVKVYANSMNEYAAVRDAPLKQGKQP